MGLVLLGVTTQVTHADSPMDPISSFGDQIRFGSISGNITQTMSDAQSQSLLWGPYRPNLYFGTRARLPDTVMTGLMWYGNQDYSGIDNIRHGCEERDGFEKYGWLKNDGRTFGTQQLKDTRNNVEITTEFIKIPGGDHGGSWGARISGKPIREGEPMDIAAMYYIGVDGVGQLKVDMSDFSQESPIKFGGNAEVLEDFEIEIEQTKGENKEDTIHYFGLNIPRGNLWKIKDITRELIIRRAKSIQETGVTDITPRDFFTFPDTFMGASINTVAFQMHYDAPFEFEVRFTSKSSPNPVTSKIMDSALAKAEADFDKRFEDSFNLKGQGYSEPQINFAKATMSNLVGGIGYFYGSSIVDASPTYEEGQNGHLEGPVARRPSPDPQHTLPASLFTAVPSRSFFPRGFYWDEGFHQTLIGQWDNDLSLEIIESWFNRQDQNGWIQREQVLGDEARSRVPEEFQVQYPEHANPPTLFKAISLYLNRLQNVTNQVSEDPEIDVTNARLLNPDLATDYLKALYPKLRTNYYWMRHTMRGSIREYERMSRSRVEGYRWLGRTKTHTLTSGLDDYPRSEQPNIGELHVDLLSWIGFMNHNLQSIAAILGEEDDVEELEEHYSAIVANIDDLHWSEENKAYCDLSVDEEDQSIHVCHKGYISLFPLLLGLVDPDSEKVGHILNLMYDPEEMWTPFGLRSLSAKDEHYGKGENYWKGPIWVNVNYLAVHSLKTIYTVKGAHQELAKKVYNELRDNLINNIFNEYERTGFVWEQYNEKSGSGQRSHPFTGWTSMVVLMMQMGRAE
ncbi:Processing alpha glucosidase I [Entomortierella beljakovae]|nr:Processing alpha glucosidase I [Entomortierella beljakovae]